MEVEPMELRQYKNTNDYISLLGMGCMRFPMLAGDTDVDYEKAQQIVDYAYQHGVNYFDTAYPYLEGFSETFIGRALQKYPRKSYYLADKMPGWCVKTMADVERIFAEQLQKCQVDYFDFYLCHALDENNFKIYEEIDIIGFLDKQKKEGKIRRLGFSFHDKPAFLEYILTKYDWDFAQIQLNYMDWTLQDAKGQYELLEAHGIPCVVMEPVRGGALATLSKDAAACFKQANQKYSVASWAIRYAASLPNVLTVLSGMSTLEQVKDNVATMTNFVPLQEADYQTIEAALEIYRKNVTIPCTACRYCIDCPKGIDIPGIFKISNNFSLSKDRTAFKNQYGALPEGHRADDCIACRNCVQHCPQSIDIPAELSKIKELAAAK